MKNGRRKSKKKVVGKVKHLPVSKKQLLIQWKARERKQLEGKEGIKTN